MRFEHVYWLVIGLAACGVLAWSFAAFARKRRLALEKFAASHLLARLTQSVSPGRRRIKQVLLVLAVACMAIALARPQMGFQWQEVKRKGIDIMIAVDTSKSMLANDVAPNRLERSKLGILDFVSRLEGDRVGLIPFAGTSFLMCPLTLDHNAFAESLAALDPSVIPVGGTNIASAIETARQALSNNANHKFLVLVTDGEDLEGAALEAARQAAAEGVTIYTVGVGTPSGELIPVVNARGGVGFIKDENGQVVKSRLDETMLRKISDATGGIYAPLGQQAEGLDAIYAEKLSHAPKKEVADRMQRMPIERFFWPLALAFLLLCAEFVLNDRKPRKTENPQVTTANRRQARPKKTAAVVMASLFLLMSLPAMAWASPASAEKAYQTGEFEKAAQEYANASEKKPEDPVLRFNLGAAAYKGGDFDKASQAFEGALGSQELAMQNQAYYNLGNTLYRQGQKTEQSDPTHTQKTWEQALDKYQAALKLNKQDEDAQYNYDFVKKRLEDLKKKQEQNQNQQCQNPNQDDKKNQDKKDQSKNQEDKNKKNQADNSGNQDKDRKDAKKDKKNQGKDEKRANQDKNGKDKKDKQQAKVGQNKKDNNRPEDKKGKDKKPGKPVQKQGQDKQEQLQAGRDRKGKMSEEEAQNLLNSLKGDDKAMPIYAGAPPRRDEQDRRDW